MMKNHAIARRVRELEQYAPMHTAQSDLADFWQYTLQQFKDKPLHAQQTKQVTPMKAIESYQVIYEGFDDTPLHGIYVRPADQKGQPIPCIVMFHGYTMNKGYPEDYAHWTAMGYAVFAIDIRSQGGDTGNHLNSDFGMSSGWLSQGLLDKDHFYYRAITVDALKAIEWVAQQADVDHTKIAVYGSSQGGGLALITSALSDIPVIAVANIPNMSHMDFGILNSESSLREAAQLVSRYPEYLDQVLETLSYFDMINLADRIQVPILISCGLKDTVCMPETVYAVYNRIHSEKEMCLYPFDGHMVSPYHQRKTMEFVQKHFG